MSPTRQEVGGSASDSSDADAARGPRRRARPPGVVVLVVVVVAALFIGLLVAGVVAQSPSSSIDARLAQGHPAPAPPFTLAVLQRGRLAPRLHPRLVGGRLSLEQLRGTPVVLNMWASWCEPCRQEAPRLERAWRREGRPRGTLFVGLDQQDAPVDARAFMRSYGIDYLNVHDAGNDVPRRYGATGVPETFFISARGQVVAHVIGVVSPAQLHEGIAAARLGHPLPVRRGGAHRASP